ncbi:hypothetical protein MTO96_045629 [Rhipicephalus appendiculatus]
MSCKRDNDDVPSLGVLRIKSDIANIASDPPPAIYVTPEENDLTRIYALVAELPRRRTNGGFLLFHIVCPREYSISSP